VRLTPHRRIGILHESQRTRQVATGARRPRCPLDIGSVMLGQHGSDRCLSERREVDPPTARDHRRQQIVRRSRDQDQHDPRGRFLEHLEQGVGGSGIQLVRLGQDEHLRSSFDRRTVGHPADGTHLIDQDLRAFCLDERHVGVSAAKDLPARITLAAAALVAVERRSQGERCKLTPDASRTDEQIRVRDRLVGEGAPQRGDGALLAHQAVPHPERAHGTDSNCRNGRIAVRI
jgi:hypothetical protein